VKSIFEKNGLQIFDVEEIPTHGGSLRIFAQRQNTGTHKISDRLITLIEKENSEGVGNLNFYQDYQSKVEKIKNDLVGFLIEAKKSGKKVVAYGAAAKGNTLLNYAGIRSDLISFVVDKNPAKQNKFMPGSRIPILAEINLKQTQPDYVVILPWNLKDEVTDQLSYIKAWGGRFVTAIPSLEVSS